jgi:hypothetical protein
MTIDKSGEFWKGTEAADLDEFLPAYAAGGYPVERTVHSQCASCGAGSFALTVDDEEGYAGRRCISCGTLVHMLDSGEYFDDASPEECACPCGGEEFELAVGYAMVDVVGEDGSPAGREVKWVSIGARCVRDGTLGVYTDWKIDYGPTDHLFGAA